MGVVVVDVGIALPADDDTGDSTVDGGASREKNLVSNFLLAFLSNVDVSK